MAHVAIFEEFEDLYHQEHLSCLYVSASYHKPSLVPRPILFFPLRTQKKGPECKATISHVKHNALHGMATCNVAFWM